MIKKTVIVIAIIMFNCGCAGKSNIKQLSWNEMFDSSDFKSIGLNPQDLTNLNNDKK